jgi:pyrroloquinoline quinone biosynthesis protein E
MAPADAGSPKAPGLFRPDRRETDALIVNAYDPEAPIGMLAELTHRCPLHCPYCSNPIELDRRSDELDTGTWVRVLTEAADIGVVQVHLSGGEPTARKDIVDLIGHCVETGLYSNLITSGLAVTAARMEAMAAAGLDHVQLSLQGTTAEEGDPVSGLAGAHAQKLRLAGIVTELGIPLTINAVIHRRNIAHVEDFVRLAVRLSAKRVEIAHAQYYGWALRNRQALMPTREQALAAVRTVERLREELKGVIVIDAVLPDYYARYPKPCMGGWASRSLNVTPTGKALPCHAAEAIPGLEFWNVKDHGLQDIWRASPAFNAFRGTGWMVEPCRSCERREMDWGGCRCQAMAITGSAAQADPACHKSPFHAKFAALAELESSLPRSEYQYRGYGTPQAPRPAAIAELPASPSRV